MNEYADRIRKENWEVREVSLETTQNFIENVHYAKGGSNTAVYCHGLFPRGAVFDGECRGVAWWLPPTHSSAEKTYPENWQGVLSLSRLAIDEGVPKNACSFLLSRSMKLIDRSKWPCLVTYADKWRGHSGTIYRATGWEYVGETKPQPVYVKNGRMVARKAGPKTRTHNEMLELGAEYLGSFVKHKFIHVL